MTRRRLYHTPREFFDNLRYVDSWPVRREVERGPKVFSDKEIETEPLKWLKYILLSRLDLLPIKEIRNIKRFKMVELELAYQSCRDIFKQSQEIPTLVIIKIIFMDKAGQLPNYDLKSINDVETAFDDINNRYSNNRSCQLWFCQSIKLRLSGRLCFSAPDAVTPDCLEIVWHTSPRKLETLSLPNFPYPYLRAVRPVGSLRFSVQEMHLPFSRGEKSSDLRKDLLQDFSQILCKFWRKRESVDALRAILYAAGAREVSLEFKMADNQFSFIDWDTEIEQC